MSCLACGSAGGTLHRVAESMFGTGEEFTYRECPECGSLSLQDVPADLAPYYPPGYYSFEAAPAPPAGVVRAVKRVRARAAVRTGWGRWFLDNRPPDWVTWLAGTTLGPRSHICDVGSGGGAALAHLAGEGFRHLLGIDPFIEAEIDGGGFTVARRSLADLDEVFDLVMFHHSFEHVRDPAATLGDAARVLRPGGYLLLRLPLAQRWAWRRHGVHWAQLDPPRHIVLFSPNGLVGLVQRHGFELVRCTYDSTGFQIWGSEQVARGVALRHPTSVAVDPAASAYSPADLDELEHRAATLNLLGDGDQAALLFRRAG